MTLRQFAAIALILLAAVPALAQVPEPDGYRGEPYKAPVPATLAGAAVIDAPRAIALHGEGVPFLDAMPRKTRPEGLPEGTIWREPPHETIPGALWLWNTGYESLADAEQARLARGLERVTGGDPSAAVVIFCRSDCWMSWNAARRAVEMGYRGIIWFPQGTEGWVEAGGAALVTAEPVDP